MLWMQGEGDAMHVTLAGQFDNNFVRTCTELERVIRTGLSGATPNLPNNVPIIACLLPPFLKSNTFPHRPVVNQKLQQLEKSGVLPLRVVSTDDMRPIGKDFFNTSGDWCHYNTKSQQDMGRKMAKKWLEAVGLKEHEGGEGIG
jgi:hypothetical protein